MQTGKRCTIDATSASVAAFGSAGVVSAFEQGEGQVGEPPTFKHESPSEMAKRPARPRNGFIFAHLSKRNRTFAPRKPAKSTTAELARYRFRSLPVPLARLSTTTAVDPQCQIDHRSNHTPTQI